MWNLKLHRLVDMWLFNNLIKLSLLQCMKNLGSVLEAGGSSYDNGRLSTFYGNTVLS